MNKNKTLWLGLGMGISIANAFGGNTYKKGDKTNLRPNVIFLVADDIGFGDLSCNGSKTIHTPNVDKLANMGIRFTDAHAVAATSTPSRYSLFTGHYAWRRNDTGVAAGNAGMVIRPDQHTVADIFKNAGYKTGAVGKWHLGLSNETGSQNWNGFITPGPQDLGFDYSYIMAATGDRVPCVWVENQRVVNLDSNDPIEVSYHQPFEGEPLGKDHPELLYKLKPSPNHGHADAIVNGISRIGFMKGGKDALWIDENIADSITHKAIRFIENHNNAPFFLYIGTNDVHVPRCPHPRFIGKSGMGPRGDALLQFDWTVGEILKTLNDMGIADNTLIVMTSDNGPVVDDGYADQAVELLGKHKPWGPFRGGKYSNFEAGTRVPMIVNWPSQVKPSVSNALMSHIDIFATMAALVNQDYPQGQGMDSVNHLDAFLGKDKKGRDYVIEQAGSLCVSTGDWKYISPSKGAFYSKLTNTELGNNTEDQLYYLADDIGEKVNVSSKNPEIVMKMKLILEKEKNKDSHK